MSSPLHEAAETEMTETMSNPLHLPLFKGTFKPSASLTFFKTSLTRLGRVRKATDQEGGSEREKEARVARPLVWTLVALEGAFVAVMMSSVVFNYYYEINNDPQSEETSIFENFNKDSFREYASLAAIPFVRLFGFIVVLADSSIGFSTPEFVSIGFMGIGHLVRFLFKSVEEGQIDRLERINNPMSKVIAIGVDVAFYFMFAYLRRRISKELSLKEKEHFVYYLLPNSLIGVFVPLLYLISETGSCWGQYAHEKEDSFTDVCHDVFVSNDAMSNAFLSSGFLYLILKPFFFKHMSMANLVGFNYPCFRTYVQFIIFGVASFGALYLFSTSTEITDNTFVPGNSTVNVKYYFEGRTKRAADFLNLGLTSSEWTQGISSLILIAYFGLIASAILPMKDKARSQQAGEETTDESAVRREENRPKLSRYLRSKLKTLRPDELAPFYRYAALVVIPLLGFLLYLEVTYRQKMFERTWEVYRYYNMYCTGRSPNALLVCDMLDQEDKKVDRIIPYSRGDAQLEDYEIQYRNFLCQTENDWTGHRNFFSCAELSGEGKCKNAISRTSKEGDPCSSTTPDYFFRHNTSGLLFTNVTLYLICLVFLGMLAISRPKASTHKFANISFISFFIYAHACLLYNTSIVVTEHRNPLRPLVDYNLALALYSTFSFLICFFILRRCRRYLGTHSSSEINYHFQRSLEVVAAALPPSLFLWLEAANCSPWGSASSAECTRLSQANFAVVSNIILGWSFFVLFNFTFKELKLEDFLRVSEKIQGFDVICRFVLMGLLHFAAMVVFGFRPRDAEPNDGQVVNPHEDITNIALNVFTPIVPGIWMGLSFFYYTKLGHDETVEAAVGEEDEDVVTTRSFKIWSYFNKKTNWILKRIRVPEGEMKLSPFLQWIFLIIGGFCSLPFLLARTFQYGSLDVNFNKATQMYDVEDLSITLWSVMLRLSGDLLIPVMVLYLTILQFCDLSIKEVSWRLPLAIITILYITDASTFFEQEGGFEKKSSRSGDLDGITWFIRQVVICTSVVFLLILIAAQKRRCYRMSVTEKRKHLFENVAYIALSTFPTLTYLIAEYFACSTELIAGQYHTIMYDWHTKANYTKADLVSDFIGKNNCEGIAYGIMPLVLMLVFSAVGRVAYPQSSDDLKMKNIMTLNLSPFRLFQMVIVSLQCLVAIICFGIRTKTRVEYTQEQVCNYYFIFTLLFFLIEGFYTSFLMRKKRGRGNDEFDVSFNEDDQPTIRIKRRSMEDRKQVGSEVSIWDGGTGGRFKPLEKDRTKRGLGDHMGDDVMGAGVLGEGNMAPGML
ncbi:hypothetical protein TrST_g4726 [Triparma strigata]|uniref:Uncharacterized protein n=1 Tax=Triparma strigata TaxID=1606541 RepID=A0A9W7AJQ9_9STRA|nr:hypothetical protein TrST_g4726 [Triparma strigata]